MPASYWNDVLVLAAAAQYGLLGVSAAVPVVLDWRRALAGVPDAIRQLLWVYGAFIVLCIVAFATMTWTLAPALLSGSVLARVVCGFIGVFWGLRLIVQLFVFDMAPLIAHRAWRAGYHGLTVVFAGLTVVYGLLAWGPAAPL